MIYELLKKLENSEKKHIEFILPEVRIKLVLHEEACVQISPTLFTFSPFPLKKEISMSMYGQLQLARQFCCCLPD